jgi:predicted CopG family antitoxin
MTEYTKFKCIVVNLSNYEKLREMGRGKSFNRVISSLIEKVEGQEPKINERNKQEQMS